MRVSLAYSFLTESETLRMIATVRNQLNTDVHSLTDGYHWCRIYTQTDQPRFRQRFLCEKPIKYRRVWPQVFLSLLLFIIFEIFWIFVIGQFGFSKFLKAHKQKISNFQVYYYYSLFGSNSYSSTQYFGTNWQHQSSNALLLLWRSTGYLLLSRCLRAPDLRQLCIRDDGHSTRYG